MEMNHTLKRLSSLVIGLLIFQKVQAGPITFNTALPVAKSQGIFRGQYVFFRATGDPTSLDRNVTVHAVPGILAYGLTPRMAIFGIVPYFHKSLELNTNSGRITRAGSGVGDALFIGRLTAYALDRAGSTIRFAPFAGLKTPTGRHNQSDRFGRLPQPLQPGSGSWDGLGGVSFTWQTTAWEFDADGGYRRNTEADSFRFGDQAFANVSFQYRLWPRELGSGVPAFLYAVVESNLGYQARSRVAGILDRNSGGGRWDIDFGLQYVTARYVIEGIIQIPTVERLHGTELGSDYQMSVGFRWNF